MLSPEAIAERSKHWDTQLNHMTFKFMPFSISTALRTRGKAAIALLTAVACLGGLSVVAPGSSIGQSALALLRDPSSILADRSPGARAAGALTQSKASKASKPLSRRAANLSSAERPLQGVQAALAPAVGGPAASNAPIFPGLVDFLPEAPGVAGDLIAPGGEGSGGGFVPGFAFPVAGGGGGGGGFFVPPQPPGVPDVGGPGGVPEPATWFTLLVGFSAIGCALRRRPRSTMPTARAAGY